MRYDVVIIAAVLLLLPGLLIWRGSQARESDVLPGERVASPESEDDLVLRKAPLFLPSTPVSPAEAARITADLASKSAGIGPFRARAAVAVSESLKGTLDKTRGVLFSLGSEDARHWWVTVEEKRGALSVLRDGKEIWSTLPWSPKLFGALTEIEAGGGLLALPAEALDPRYVLGRNPELGIVKFGFRMTTGELGAVQIDVEEATGVVRHIVAYHGEGKDRVFIVQHLLWWEPGIGTDPSPRAPLPADRESVAVAEIQDRLEIEPIGK